MYDGGSTNRKKTNSDIFPMETILGADLQIVDGKSVGEHELCALSDKDKILQPPDYLQELFKNKHTS